jgi:hypothetical protein
MMYNTERLIRHRLSIVFVVGIISLIMRICEAQTTCSDGKSYNGACYKAVDTYLNWKDARDHCISWGGNLVSIHTAAENAFVRDYASVAFSGSPAEFWTGFTKLGNNAFYWSDDTRTQYMNWLSGQPDNYQSSEECSKMEAGQGKWSDINCNLNSRFVCKRSVCEWATDLTSFGAPKPTFSITTANNQDVYISIVMANKQNITHFVSFSEITSCDDRYVPEKLILSNLDANAYWEVTPSECSTSYTLKMTVQQFLWYPNVEVKRIPGTDIFEAHMTTYASFLDDEKGPCTLTTFRTTMGLKVYLLSDSFSSTLNGNQVDLLSVVVNSIRPDDDDHLILDLNVKNTIPGKQKDFILANQVGTVTFTLLSSTETCDGQGLCTYHLILETNEVKKDYTDGYKLKTTLVTTQGTNLALSIDFNLMYAFPTPPDVVNA